MHLSSIASAALVAIAASSSCLLGGADAAVVPPSDGGVVRLPLIRSANGQLAQLKHLESTPLDKREARASLYNAFGREYLIEVGVGTPAQMFNLTLDTGSAELWIPSTACPATSCPYDRFDSSKSSTFEATVQSFSIEYGVGTAEGTYGVDTVTVGTAKVDKQTIGLASNSGNILGIVSSGEQSNGILGLGFGGLNTARGASNDEPFPFNLASTLNDPVFSIFLNSHFSFGVSGEIMFGGIDTSKHTGDIQYVPVVNYDTTNYLVSPNVGADGKKSGTNLYWSVAGQGVKANSYSKSLPSVQAFILDTGTTLTMIPKTYAEGILGAVTGSTSKYSWDELNGVYRIDCSFKTSTDKVEFQISTATDSASTSPVTISTPVSEMIIPLDSDYIDSATSCMFGITASSSGLTAGESWIIGEASLRSMYSVYDMKNNRVGLAPVNLDGAGKYTPARSDGQAIDSTTTSTTQDNQNDDDKDNDTDADAQSANDKVDQGESKAPAGAAMVNLAMGAAVSAMASYWLM
ncbi:aspartic peptidase domain-containing protein [Zychaea mexicana]|uniref:aspartic peptidase domain-containing protein n=1 Tax=Zychaea mexicana TaxID=64656 RepID=UPI0022FEE4C1|nr:aspartic peptidase domain-containing protein [Zychaea mexicana]KAI9488759.1 aspartic peptidase domain-containing protein [Zychaea mexicana]